MLQAQYAENLESVDTLEGRYDEDRQVFIPEDAEAYERMTSASAITSSSNK